MIDKRQLGIWIFGGVLAVVCLVLIVVSMFQG